MKIGVASYAYRWAVGTNEFRPSHPFTPSDFINKSKEAGAEVVQICDNFSPESFSDEQIQALKKLSQDVNIELEVGFKGGIDNIPHQLNVTNLLGSKIMRLVVDDPFWKSVNKFAEKLSFILPDLHATNIKLAIENHFLHTPEEIIRIIEKVNDPFVGVCLDPLNSTSQLVCPKETISLMAPYAISVHIKDVVIHRYQTGFYIGGCPLGDGLLNIEEFIGTVKKYDHSPNIFLEGWLDKLDNEQETLEKEQNWIEQGIKYLRRIV